MDESPPIDLARIADELDLGREQVSAVVALLDEGNTVPFITRYRKERTGNLDEVGIRRIQEKVRARRQLAERSATILRLIDSQGKLTPELRAAIEGADSLKRLEDLYLPYRPKRTSRASKARERGLAPLAESIWNGAHGPGELSSTAAGYVDPDRELPDAAAALQGAADILAEGISEDAEVRAKMRELAWTTGRLTVSAAKTDEAEAREYRDYFDYSESVSRIPPHRILALNRGEKAGALRVGFGWDDERARRAVGAHYRFADHPCAEFLQNCAADALTRLILPSLRRELRRELSERAESHAVRVFAENLRSLLLQPPLRGQRVLALDPGFRTGCKLVVLDECGRPLADDRVYVTGSGQKRAAARGKLASRLREHGCRLVAIGNGTACRETEELVAETIAEELPDARYVIVNEAGASVYSTSPAAGEEFPDLDPTVRGTISIGRRLQDPLSELVKIDPQHLGVGMYQHDIDQRQLKESLDEVVESCVNYVGVDLNTASASLLKHVSGFNQLIARRVVDWRSENGGFATRRQLRAVPGVGEATFTQAAGFLKILGGDEPLDGTWIHPESYGPAGRILQRLAMPAENLVPGSPGSGPPQGRLNAPPAAELARELGIGELTCRDILEALARPGRDPRTDLPGPVFKQGVLKLADLYEGMELTGTVLNVVDFGAFVDIGLKDSGLVHVSKMARGYVKSPRELVAVGDLVKVWVLGVDHERRRVSLTMVPPGSSGRADSGAPSQAKPRRPKRGGSGKRRRASRGRSAAEKPPPPRDGGEPMKGFDELKALWQQRRGS